MIYILTMCHTDAEGTSREILATFEDETVAALVAETLTEKVKRLGLTGYYFPVERMEPIKAQSESRVNGIAKQLLDTIKQWRRL